jgi:hypothetical protein
VLFTKSLTKLSLHFSDFSTIFKRFYKNLQSDYTIEVPLFHRDRWMFSGTHTYGPRLHKTPCKDLEPCNAALGHGGDTASANPGEPAALPDEEVVELDHKLT